MTSTEKAITIILALVIALGLLAMVCIERNNLSDKEKGSIILVSIMFWFYSLIAIFSF